MDHGIEIQRVRALGKMLGNLVGQEVVLIGNVLDVHPGGSSLKFRTSDNVDVNVSFNYSLDEMPDGWVQLWGSVVGPNSVAADDMWQFRTPADEDPAPYTFDAETYNGAVAAFHEMKDLVHTIDAGVGGDMF